MVQYWYELGVTYQMLKNKPKAIECLQKTIDLPQSDAADPPLKIDAAKRLKKIKINLHTCHPGILLVFGKYPEFSFFNLSSVFLSIYRMFKLKF